MLEAILFQTDLFIACSRNEGIPSPLHVGSRQNEGGCERDQGCANEEHDELHMLAHNGNHSSQGKVSQPGTGARFNSIGVCLCVLSYREYD